MAVRRRLFVGFIFLAITGSLSGCQSAFNWGESSPRIDDSDVVGTWIADGPDGLEATVLFSANGTAILSGLPSNLTDPWASEPDWSTTVDGEADWHLWTQPSGVTSVQLSDFESMVVMEDADGLHLAAYVGDPDARIRVVFDQTD